MELIRLEVVSKKVIVDVIVKVSDKQSIFHFYTILLVVIRNSKENEMCAL